MEKVKGHPKVEDLEAGRVEAHDAMGNELADGVAGAIAGRMQVEERVKRQLDEIE